MQSLQVYNDWQATEPNLLFSDVFTDLHCGQMISLFPIVGGEIPSLRSLAFVLSLNQSVVQTGWILVIISIDLSMKNY